SRVGRLAVVARTLCVAMTRGRGPRHGNAMCSLRRKRSARAFLTRSSADRGLFSRRTSVLERERILCSFASSGFRELADGGDDMIDTRTVEESARATSEGMEEARDRYGEMRERISHMYDEGISRARTLEKDLEEAVRRNPVQSILIAAGIAAGIGLLVGYLSARD